MSYENKGYSYQNGVVSRNGTPLSALEEFEALDDLIRFLIEMVGLSIDEVVILLGRSLGLRAAVIRKRVMMIMKQIEDDAELERDTEPEGPAPW